ncbi:MAG: N-acetylglucosamine-6-phosphate deacetylase [Intestinibacillus sp.]
MIIRNVMAFQEGGSFVPGELCIADGRFTDVPSGEVVDGGGCYAIPGLVDIHLHGCSGFDFCDGTPKALSAIAGYEAWRGVAAMCPTLMSFPEERLRAACENAVAFRPDDAAAALAGIHMEGPFLAPLRKGAQNGAYLHRPDVGLFRRLQRAAGGKIRLLGIAPELPGALGLIEELRDEVTLSLAHTDADYDTACEAFRRGARHVTHLFNAMPPFLHRAPGVVGAAFDAPDCRVELIADGVHLHPGAVRAAFRLFGDNRVILVSDSMMATGLPDGAYTLGGQAVTVSGRRATLRDGTLTGSVTDLLGCLRTAVRDMDVPLGSAVKAATVNPAKAVGIFDQYGSLTPGKPANLVLLDSDLNLRSVFLRGMKLF